MAENKFMNLLSDIDEKYIKDMTKEKEGGQEDEEPYQTAEIITVEGKKKSVSFFRIFSYAAAALLITAAVGFGLHFMRGELPAENDNTTAAEITNAESTGAATHPNTDNTPIPTVAIKDLLEFDFDSLVNEHILDDYPSINVSQIPDISDAFEKIFQNYDDESERVITKAILDTKKCGAFNLSLIGYGLLTDKKTLSDKIISFAGFRIVLELDDKVVASEMLTSDLLSAGNGASDFSNFPWFMLLADSISETTEIMDFGDNQIIIARVIDYEVSAATQFYGVKDSRLYLCKRLDTIQASVEYTSGDCNKYDSSDKEALIRDELFGKTFDFEFFDDAVAYTVVNAEGFLKEISEYPIIDEMHIPNINEMELKGTFKEKADHVKKYSLTRGTIDMLQEGNIALYLVGEYLRTETKNDPEREYINCSCLKILVYDHVSGEFIGQIPIETGAVSQMTREQYAELMPRIFIMKDTALIVKDLSSSNYGAGCFYAVKEGRLYGSLNGEYFNALPNTQPEWTKGEIEYNSIYADYENNSIICGFKKYVFNFDILESYGYVYSVYWLEKDEFIDE